MNYCQRNAIARSAFSLLITLAVICCFSARAGLLIYGTRFIMHEDEPTLEVVVKNTATSAVLVSSKVTGINGTHDDSTVPFIITPPLFSLKAGRINKLRIICPDCNILPGDRESAFLLNIAAIPAGEAGNNTVQIAIRSQFKLFWRPSGLSGDVQNAYKKLQWKQDGLFVRVRNPTPYFVTLFNVKVDGVQKPPAGMVPPFGEIHYTWGQSDTKTRGNVQWQSLDDNGNAQPAWHIYINKDFSVGEKLY